MSEIQQLKCASFHYTQRGVLLQKRARETKEREREKRKRQREKQTINKQKQNRYSSVNSKWF